MREPSAGLRRLVAGLALLSVVVTSSFNLLANLGAGEPCIVLNLFLSARFVVVRLRMVEFVGVLFDTFPSRVVVGLRTLGRLVTGLAAPRLRADTDVAVDVRRIGAGAFLVEGVVAVVVAVVDDGAIDMRLGLAVIPSLFDSSSVVLSSTEASEGLTR